MKIKTAEKKLKQAKIDALKKLLINAKKVEKLGGETDHDIDLLKSLIKTGKHSGYSSHELKYGGQAAIDAIQTAGITLTMEYECLITDSYSYWPGDERVNCTRIYL